MAKPTPYVEMFTDGACSGNPGKGGWGTLLRFGNTEKEMSGADMETTNNRMELMAVIMGLENLKRPCRVKIYTDSKYVMQGASKWLEGWKAKGWKTSSKKPVKNAELWRRLDEVMIRHDISWEWVKGHSGHVENERVDQLARDAIGTL
ncbi:MAG: ribonuclease HI [Alphaproteobacteria bacterium]|nr:ribonuclease HI [Alphaproteobacteria bacterium]